MIAADMASRAGAPKQTGFSRLEAAARLQLCAVAEDGEVRGRHIAALLAFAPSVARCGKQLRFVFEHGPTAMWVSEVLGNNASLVDVGAGGGVVDIDRPQIVLGRYGFRDGRWFFGQGMDAALGISRGAVHAAGTLNRQGLKIECPSAPMMLTLTAVMTRLGIEARPTEGQPRTAISAGDVPAALDLLGIEGVAQDYRRLRETKTVARKRS